MMLDQKSCIPCHGGMDPLSAVEVKKYLEMVPKWKVNEAATRLFRKFLFKDFMSAFDFVKAIVDIAESEGHHPDITFGWGYCFIEIYTHKINGLHLNDFILASKINEIKKSSSKLEK